MDTTPRLLQAGPFRFGFIAATGVLLALALGFAVASLAQALTLIFLALFISLGLKPIVWRLERMGVSKVVALLIVLAGFLLFVALLVWLIMPVVVDELGKLIAYLPEGLDQIEEQDWFVSLNDSLGGALAGFVTLLQETLADPNFWVTVGGGALRVGIGVVNGVFSVIFVVALTLYFVIGHEQMKDALVRLVPASKRVGFRDIAEQIITSVGKYLNGMVILAIMNALFTFIVLTSVGVRYAGLLAAIALPITFIPLVGSVISAIIATTVAFFTSPTAGLVTLILLLVYMQVEAYVFTPRIVGKAIEIPGSLVLIGALIGGTLLGLLGALVACPVSASLVLIVKKVVMPIQDAK
ncbi:AI-2E family transporter [Protaetiibacter mangrovi]|uniref:AI-2E family transporter n=2 Tax=Microbacteriaceae TaxID=85023 RepID=A0ABT1ZF25_9MICO|nr:AI-2E family transporter [Protaetiibacter mangrovi]MCS0499308.1 AI-2E family transporter [Protaetiibacter mangrovi]TPX02436.1 AI-2E family transporter [Schumannella luteola]